MRKKTDERIKKAQQMYLQGISMEEIANELDLKVSTIRTYVGKMKLKKTKWEEIRNEIAIMYSLGEKISEIEKKFGVTKQYISKVIKRKGIKTRRNYIRYEEDNNLVNENIKFAEEKAICEKVIIKGKVFVNEGKFYRENKIYTDITKKIGGI